MYKLKYLILLTLFSMSLVGCGKTQEKVQVVPDVKLDMQYSYESLTVALDAIANNAKVTKEIIDDIDNMVDNHIKTMMENKEFNNNTNAEILNTYRSEDTIFMQVKTDDKYELYKLKVKDNKIVDCVIYENLN